MKVLVYLPEEKLAPKGGPLAVGYYYHEEMQKRGDNILEFTHVDKNSEDIHGMGRAITSRLPKWFNTLHRTFRGIVNRRRFLAGKEVSPSRDYDYYDIIHFHQANDMYNERENLKNYNGIVIYQSHSPLPYGQEQCSDISPLYRWCIPNMEKKYEVIDRYCFERADYVIFPCIEAEEPYSKNWDFFDDFKKKNIQKFRYVLTGIKSSFAATKRDDVLKQHEIPNESFVIVYVGRHNTVKGYDILKEIAAKHFEDSAESWVISAGLESPFKRLDHPRWKEIGFTNDPHSLIVAGDVFFLPNRVTYFDIVMIEVLSLGKIVIASRTGGNKYFERMGLKGVFLYDSIEEACSLLLKIKEMTEEDRRMLGEQNKFFYEENLSSKAMYENYLTMLKSLQSDVL